MTERQTKSAAAVLAFSAEAGWQLRLKSGDGYAIQKRLPLPVSRSIACLILKKLEGKSSVRGACQQSGDIQGAAPTGNRKAGKALKVSIYVSEGRTHHGIPVYSSILDFLFYKGVSGATVVKGVAGFGADHHMHSANIVEISDHMPLKIEFIEAPEKVNELLGKLEELAGTGMIEVQETTIRSRHRFRNRRRPRLLRT